MQRWTTVEGWRRGLGILGAGALLVLAGPAVPAGGAPAEEHCVVHVTGMADDGELRTTPPVCSPDRDRAMAAARRSADWPIGVHFDGAGYTGSSFTVVGSSCIGGWLNLPAAWDNRVSSTSNGCPVIRHFDHDNLVAPSEATVVPGGNLTGMNNRTNSIQYLP